MTKTIVGIVLLFFVGVNIYALADGGLSGLISFFAEGSSMTVLLTVDLCIALGLCVSWMIGDAKRRNMSVAPYVLLTMTTGSIGPLVYLLRRD